METNNRPNAKAIASLAASCISVLNCCLWQLAILCAVFGIVLGIIALREENPRQKDLAVAGIGAAADDLDLHALCQKAADLSAAALLVPAPGGLLIYETSRLLADP